MPKQVTEDDLASGLSGFGDGFSSINEKRPKRDNPFRDTRSASPSETKEGEEKVVEMRPGGVLPEASKDIAQAPAPRVEVSRSETSKELLERARAHQLRSSGARSIGTQPTVTPQTTEQIPERIPTIEESARAVRITFPEPEPEPAPSIRKADIFTERVTLSVSTEMRDSVEALAREMQRRRTRKDERITANTVMRVAINSLLDAFALEDSDVANSEEELLELAKRKSLR